jgi:hypothetical protein
MTVCHRRSYFDMKPTNLEPDDARLGALLRESRAAPPVPPRFQENVWRRIESADARNVPVGDGNWLDAVAAWILRPRLAFALAAMLVLTGLGLGWSKGEQLARDDAQARYLTAVAPDLLR